MSSGFNMYENYCSPNEAGRITTNAINKTLFICPRCGMVFGRLSKHNYGICCSFCATDKDLRKIQEHKEQVRKQLQELQEEVERSLKDESTI